VQADAGDGRGAGVRAGAGAVPGLSEGDTQEAQRRASFYDPDLLVRFKRAAEDLGSEKGLFGLLPGGDGSGLVYLTDDAVGVIMPMRAGAIDADFCQWAAA
jgi:hypothetical protein